MQGGPARGESVERERFLSQADEEAWDTNSTNGDKGNAFIVVTAGHAHSTGIQRRLLVHQEQIAMMPMMQPHLDIPRAIGLANHRMSAGPPIIEVAHQRYRLCLRGNAKKIDGLFHP